MVHRVGLEPTRLAAQASYTCMATNYITRAYLAETPRLERGHRLHDGHLSRVLDYHYHMSPYKAELNPTTLYNAF